MARPKKIVDVPYSELCRKLRLYRFRIARISQSELGRRIGASQATMSQIESGVVRIPDGELNQIARAMGTTLEAVAAIPMEELMDEKKRPGLHSRPRKAPT